MKKTTLKKEYFLYGLPILKKHWEKLNIPEIYKKSRQPKNFFTNLSLKSKLLQQYRYNPLTSAEIHLFSTLNRAYRHLILLYVDKKQTDILFYPLEKQGLNIFSHQLSKTVKAFVKTFAGRPFLNKKVTQKSFLAKILSDVKETKLLLYEMIILYIAEINPATDRLKPLFDTTTFSKTSYYHNIMNILFSEFEKNPAFEGQKVTSNLKEFLLSPIKHNPNSLFDQLSFIIKNFGYLLPPEIYADAIRSLDIYKEETAKRDGCTAIAEVLEFKHKEAFEQYPEPEQFTPDRDWMANVVLIAKMVYVWLYQLSHKYNREISRLDQIPDEELDTLAKWGINAIWLIGVWKRSPASQKIKHLSGNTDAIASAYSLYSYEIADELGGYDALLNLKERAAKRGIRLASDMVPNHTGIYSEWIIEHPEWFIQSEEPPYPNYQFTGENLSYSKEVSIYIEDGYWTKTDAAVVFKYVDNRTGKTRYIYHGNDGTSTPWNDTAQLNYLLPEVRQAVLNTILKVAKLFPIIRFDAAMTLTKRHYQRLWFPQPGHGGAIPSRSYFSMTKEEFDRKMPKEFWREVVDTISTTAPDTLLLAEAFWLMEGYFVRTLGMHRVYNSAFMNMIKMEENSKYRKTIKNVIEFDPEILKRFVNFMNNPDEKTAIEQFGKENKYFGAAVMLVTMPGLPMFGHGQIEGFQEKYGMEYKRCYLDEQVDEHLVKEHETRIFPLLKKRYLFSGSEHFVFYDFYAGNNIDENVFVYSNIAGGERAIVIYHNKFASTKGWFKTSTPFLKKGSSPSLVRKTLKDALQLKDETDCYYLFKDYGDNLFYIRNAKLLCEQGLYMELNAYEYHVFMDFKEVFDDESKTWQRVHDHLNGRGDENIFELYKILKHQNVLEAIKNIIFTTKLTLESLFELDKNATLGFDEFDKASLNLIQALKINNLISDIQVKEFEKLFFDIKHYIEFLRKHKRLFRMYVPNSSKIYALFSLAITIDLLKKTALFSLEKDELGLIPYLKRENILEAEGLTITEYLQILPRLNILTIKEEKRYKDELVSILKEDTTKKFLKANDYNNILWYNKERFEELASLLLLASVKEKTTSNIPACSMGGMIKRVTKLLISATKANYQFSETISIIIGN